MRLEAELYDRNELKLNGITRAIDDEIRRFQHPNRDAMNRRRDEIYALNAMMRQREKRRFEEYVLATEMSEAQADAMRLEEVAAGAQVAEAVARAEAEAAAEAEVAAASTTASDRWVAASASLSALLCDMAKAIDAARPPTREELEAIARSAEEEQMASSAGVAVEAAMEAVVEAALDEALGEAALDVGAEHVLTANGIGIERELAPSEVYKRAMERAQKEFDRATRAYHRSERDRLSRERESARASAIKRRMHSILTPLDQTSQVAKPATTADGFYSSSPYLC